MSNLRPEEEYTDSNDFYTFQESNRYNNNTGMHKMQLMLTKIALDLINFNSNLNYKILDIGCGTGFSLDYLVTECNQNKKDLVGIDPSIEMLNITTSKGYQTYELGFEDLKELTKNNNKNNNKNSDNDNYNSYENYFDIIISISALNWVCTNKVDIELKNIIKKIGKEMYKLLKYNGKAVIQFYPGSKEIFEIVKSSFSRCNFKVEEYIYNKESQKKIKYFLILHKTIY